MKRRKRKRMGTLALSVLLASSLSTPTVAMAAEAGKAEANQTDISTETDNAAVEQPAAPASGEASGEQSTAPASVDGSGEQSAVPAPEKKAIESSPANQAKDVRADNTAAGKAQESEAKSRSVRRAPQQGAQNVLAEPAADTVATAPNNVNTAVPSDDKQGSDISYGFLFPSTATITPADANSDKTLGDVSRDFRGSDFGAVKAGDLVVKGDMSIDGDTTREAAHDVGKDSTHDIRADLDVSAIHTSIDKTESLVNNAKSVYVNNMETGLRSTFRFGTDLNGEFYVPTSLEDAKTHYILSSADGAPMIFRINYANSTFAKDKVSILMDLDLTHMHALNTTYDNSQKVLYGENGVMENFNHTGAEYGSTYDTSTFGNFKQLIMSSAKKISLMLKDVLLHSATGSSTTTETDTETVTTTQGSIDGTLVGYMKADVGHSFFTSTASYVWGAMQDTDGRDVKAVGYNVMLTAQFTEKIPKVIPVTPDTPVKPDTPDAPVKPNTPITPVKPDTAVTPVKPATPSMTKNSITRVKADQAANAVTVSRTSEIPQTGDTSKLYLWLAAMLTSAGIFVTGMVHLKKKKSSK